MSDLIQIEPRRSPSINRSIDNTALQAYMECPRKYLYSMVMSRRSKGRTKPALAYGTCWHAGLEAHYKTGGDQQSVIKAMINAWEQHDNPEDHRTLERCVSEYGKYLQAWGDHDTDLKNNGRTIGYPDQPVVEQSAEVWWEGALHPYAGKIDRIFEHHGLYYVEDHKTTSALGPYYFRQFDPSNQMMGYAVIAQELTGLPIAGVRINAHAVLKTTSKFERQFVTFSQPRLDEWKRNYNVWIRRIEDSMLWVEAARGEGTQESPGVPEEEALLAGFQHNFNACAGKYGSCTYTEVCTMPPNIRQRVLEQDFEVNPWDPMKEEDAE